MLRNRYEYERDTFMGEFSISFAILLLSRKLVLHKVTLSVLLFKSDTCKINANTWYA
jgi:hypothetical protein